jgi:hypothetical protein
LERLREFFVVAGDETRQRDCFTVLAGIDASQDPIIAAARAEIRAHPSQKSLDPNPKFRPVAARAGAFMDRRRNSGAAVRVTIGGGLPRSGSKKMEPGPKKPGIAAIIIPAAMQTAKMIESFDVGIVQ